MIKKRSYFSDALKSLKKGQMCGVDGLAADYFIYAIFYYYPYYLNILLHMNSEYLPSDVIQISLVPILKV